MDMSVTQPLKGHFQTRYLENQATTFIKIMELLQPGGVLERFDYAKLPRIAQYEVIKEVLWVAYQVGFTRFFKPEIFKLCNLLGD